MYRFPCPGALPGPRVSCLSSLGSSRSSAVSDLPWHVQVLVNPVLNRDFLELDIFDKLIIISCQLGGGWDCGGGELDELLPGHLHRSASRPTYDGQGQHQN